VPEYLAPGVFVEEVSFRAKSIEGVPTSTTGFAGSTRWGPVRYAGGPTSCEPRLVTSYGEFERAYGRLDLLAGDRLPYLAHATRAFFLNGGKRLYVSRVFTPLAGNGVAGRAVAVATTTPSTATWRARWPGDAGNVLVTARATRSSNVAVLRDGVVQATRARAGSIVEVLPAAGALPDADAPLDPATLRVVRVDPATARQAFESADGSRGPVPVDARLLLVELQVHVLLDEERADSSLGLSTDPESRRFVGHILQRDDPEDEDSVVWLDYDFPTVASAHAIPLLLGLVGTTSTTRTERLAGGNDGAQPQADDLRGVPADLDVATLKATGLEALADIDDIAIVALPEAGALPSSDARVMATQYLVRHAEAARYRIAVVDGPEGSSINEIRAFRSRFDSKYAALYHPWVEVLDPTASFAQGAPPQRLMLPPSGFVAGIYARSDVERGVHKAPANEVVHGLTRFEANINTGRQQVLNPEGINALRFFPGRGSRVWGARTLSSDPEWKYVNVRRFFIYVEHSLDKATQWAVFEPNNEALWRNITRTVKDFLEVQWRDGALLGSTPDEAFFVRCDRTTMTQNDLDNGRLICLVGMAPTRPAEFVVFRVGQWTADARA
jgi:uncharacterized protein